MSRRPVWKSLLKQLGIIDFWFAVQKTIRLPGQKAEPLCDLSAGQDFITRQFDHLTVPFCTGHNTRGGRPNISGIDHVPRRVASTPEKATQMRQGA